MAVVITALVVATLSAGLATLACLWGIRVADDVAHLIAMMREHFTR